MKLNLWTEPRAHKAAPSCSLCLVACCRVHIVLGVVCGTPATTSLRAVWRQEPAQGIKRGRYLSRFENGHGADFQLTSTAPQTISEARDCLRDLPDGLTTPHAPVCSPPPNHW